MANIIGSNDGETLNDTPDHDIITALDGDDTIIVTNGGDEVHGGGGFDTLIIDYSNATTAMFSQGGVGTPVGPAADGGGSYHGFFGDLLNRFVSYDGIEKFIISTGSANDVIFTGTGANVTDDIVNLGGGNDETSLGRGIDSADGGAGVDGLDADFSQVATAISIDLNANSYTGVTGTSFTNFEYFADRDGGFRTGTGNDVVVTGSADLDDNVRLGAGNDSVKIYDGTDFVVGYGLDTPAGEGGFDTLVVDYSAATANITTDGGFLQVDASGQGWDGRITDGGSRFAMFYGFDRFDITTGSGNDVFNYFNLVSDSDNVFHLGAGNDSVNLSQSTGDNYLDGGTGNDTMTGGFGNDTYVVDSASDVINDFFGGIDEVRTSLVSYTLASDLENLTGIGNVNQGLTGNASANVIDGGLGSDAIYGFGGNDTLVVTGGTTGADTSFELADGGADSDLLIVDYGAMTVQVGLYVQSDGAGGATGFADIPDGTRRLSFTGVERIQLTTGTGNDTVNGFQGDDVIHTGAGNDLIIAGAGNDLLDGGSGADDMRGGDGDDTYVVDSLGDGIEEFSFASSGADLVTTSLASYTLANNVENLTGTSDAGQTLIGNGLANVINGADGADLLIGARGDSLYGNGGDDILRLGFGVAGGLSFAQGGAGGSDTLRLDFSDYAGAVSTGIGPDESGGNSGAFMDPAGSFPVNILVAFSSIERFEITGSESADTLTTGAGDDDIAGGGGNDSLNGGAGTDTAIFSGNRDDYDVTGNVDGTYTIVDLRGGSPDGSDTLANFEFVRFADGTRTVAGLLNEAPVVDLNAATPGINDTGLFVEGLGNAAIGTAITVSDSNGDSIVRAVVTIADPAPGDALVYNLPLPSGISVDPASTATNLILTGAASAQAYQEALGQVGFDSGSDDPTVGGTDTTRTVTVTVNDGTVDSAPATMTLTVIAADDAAVARADGFEITEAGSIVAGNLFADNGAGADSDPDGPPLAIFAVNGNPAAVGQQIVLDSGALLTVRSNGTFDYDPNGAFDETPVPGTGASNTPDSDSFTYTLTGGGTATVTITITGIDTDDRIEGTAAADLLVADGGADTLAGFGGDDFLVVDADDSVEEADGEGYDNVLARASFTLTAGAYVEVLSTDDHGGTADIDLTGNALANIVIGNAGSNFLDGGGGTDRMAGLGGDDFLFVDSADDIVDEAADGGYDNVLARTSYTLTAGAEVEVLSTDDHAGTAAIDLFGNELANIVIGNAGSNVLDGGQGEADRLAGLGGDDVMYVDTGDVVDEAAGGGYDNVVARSDYQLTFGARVEVLSTTDHAGTAGIDLTGNDYDNVVIGNAGDNVLDGSFGHDRLAGLGGADSYAFTTYLSSFNWDTVDGFVSGSDRFLLDDAVFTGMTAGPLAAGAFVNGTAALDADDRIIYDNATGALYFDADGSGAGAQVQFALVESAPLIVATDFTVI